MNDLDCVFITNDDGLCNGLEDLISNLHEFKIPLLVVVPSENKSACSMSISLRKKMRLSRQKEIEETQRIRNFIIVKFIYTSTIFSSIRFTESRDLLSRLGIS